MSDQSASSAIKIAILCIITLGCIALIASVIYISSFFAIVGLSLAFWGAILLYLIPTNSKNILFLIGVASEIASSNIEQLLTENNLSKKGIYILKNDYPVAGSKEQSMIPNKKSVSLFFTKNQNRNSTELDLKNGFYITPPGNVLCRVFETQIGKMFSQITLDQSIKVLPAALTSLKLAESVDIIISKNAITVTITKSAFDLICEETDKYPITQKQVGSLLSSAIACAFAKVTGQPVLIKSESYDAQSRVTRVQYTYGSSDKDCS